MINGLSHCSGIHAGDLRGAGIDHGHRLRRSVSGMFFRLHRGGFITLFVTGMFAIMAGIAFRGGLDEFGGSGALATRNELRSRNLRRQN
jgi:hypothetical protein